MPYLTFTEFQTLSLMPHEDIAQLELRASGWVGAQLEDQSSFIDARLRKRYDAPFAEPFPKVVQSWLARLVTYRCFLRLGVRQTDEQFQAIAQDRADALEEIKEAAESKDSLLDLPLRADTTATGIRGGTFAYTERSPYAGFDVQRDAARDEDTNRGGSYV